jgi:exopolysaccharide/PEP-CTERM locus tyrosine autokinase
MSRIEKALKKARGQRQEHSKIMPSSPLLDQLSEGQSEELSLTSESKRRNTLNKLLDVVPLKITHLLLATAREEKNNVVEEFNKLRSSVIALTKGENFKNTLLVTSTVSEEGKSMAALNLAISMAKEQDHTVLLIDTDLRRPSVHRYLGIEPKIGLVHCLRDGLPIEDALVKTGVGKLVVLPAGEAVKDPLDMLSSNRMKTIVNEIKERYADRYIIFDTPPALPFADAGVLAAIVDSTLFVVREGKATKADLIKTLDEFREHNLLGVIFNDAHTFAKKQNYYYY